MRNLLFLYRARSISSPDQNLARVPFFSLHARSAHAHHAQPMRSWQLEWFGPLRRLPGPAAQLAGGLLTLARPAPSLGQKSAQQPADHCWPSICIRRPGVDLGGAKTGGRLFLPKTLAPFISFLSLSSNHRAAAGHGGQRSGGAAASSSRRR